MGIVLGLGFAHGACFYQELNAGTDLKKSFVSCAKSLVGRVIGKHGQGLKIIQREARDFANVRYSDSRGGFEVTAYTTKTLEIVVLKLQNRIKQCNAKPKAMTKRCTVPEPERLIFGSRYAVLAEDSDSEDDDESKTVQVRSRPEPEVIELGTIDMNHGIRVSDGKTTSGKRKVSSSSNDHDNKNKNHEEVHWPVYSCVNGVVSAPECNVYRIPRKSLLVAMLTHVGNEK